MASDYFSQQKYDQAVNTFWAAKDCDDLPDNNDIDALIRQANAAWVQSLEQTNKQLENLHQEAETKKQEAIVARNAEAEARQLAEQNAETAATEGRKAEALRLFVLAESARLNNSKKEALLLSYMGWKMLADKKPELKKEFYEAVIDSFSASALQDKGTITGLYPFAQHNKIVVASFCR